MPIATLNFNYVDKRTINNIYENCLCFTALEDNFVLSIKRGNNHDADITKQNYNFYYSLDNGYTWSTVQFIYDANEAIEEETISIPAINNGKKILIRGYNNTTLDGINFSTSNKCNVSGNLMTLLDYDTALTKNSIPEYCFFELFKSTKIVDASKLILPDFVSVSAYFRTFQSCPELIAAPALPATILAESCYYSMFSSCTSLTTAPALPATILAESCYAYMFSRCTSLVQPPALPANILADSCYMFMFNGCTSLNIGPGLPATILAESCYAYMFSGCTSLVQPPALPATILVNSCYMFMFRNCTSMIYAPHLPADYIPKSAYRAMFSGCKSLNYINIHAIQRESNSLLNWVNNVASSGTFVKHPNATYDIDSVSGVPIGWTVHNEGDYIPTTYTVTININNDAWGSVIGSGTYAEGATVTLQAYPNDGYKFKWWVNNNATDSSNPLSFTLQEDMHLTAVFEEISAVPDTYTVNLSTIGNSTGYTLTGAGTYIDGDLVSVDVIRDTTTSVTTTFNGWYTLTDSEYKLYSEDKFFTFNINENKTFYAKFVDIPTVNYTVYAGLDTESSEYGTVTGTGTYADGNNATVNATPKTGYEFVYWRIDDQYNVTDNPYTFKVTKNTQLLAHIRPIVEKYDLRIENSDPWHSDISVREDGRLIYGKNIKDLYEESNRGYVRIDQTKYSVTSNATVTLTAQNNHVDLLEFDGWYTIDDEYITLLISNEQTYSFVMNDPMKICCKWKPVDTIDETDYSKEYFTITALDDCAVYADIILRRDHQNELGIWFHHTAIPYTLEYSINGGEWQQKIITKSDEDIKEIIVQVTNLMATDKMRIRCVMPCEYTVSSEDKKYIVKRVTLRTGSIEKDQNNVWPLRKIPCRISGNLLSLVYGSQFLNNNTLGYNYLRFPFYFRNIFDAYNVVFPILSDPSLNENWENRATYYANWDSYLDFDDVGNESMHSESSYYDAGDGWPGRFAGILADNTYMIRGPKSIGLNTYEGDYQQLLENNHNLYNAPICPAETVAANCYLSMLECCHSLQKPVPVLPALELQPYCYSSMYERCYMLQDPGILSANTLADRSCKHMYAGCRSMMTGPIIPTETVNFQIQPIGLMFGDCINMSFLEVHFKYRTGDQHYGIGNFLGFTKSQKEEFGGDDQEGWAKKNLGRLPQKPGRFYRYANTEIDPNTGKPLMSRETLAFYGTEFPDNWTFEDIPT